MLEWLTSKVLTSVVVLAISLSFLGLFGMQADYYRELELRDLANAVTDLVTEIDLLGCEARLEVNWTSTPEPCGLPRAFHGEPYRIRFTPDRPYVEWGEERVAGRFFPSRVRLVDQDGSEVSSLSVPSILGFTVSAQPTWSEHGPDFIIAVAAAPG